MKVRQKVDFTFGPTRVNKRPGKVPTVSRMMALALYYERLIKKSEVNSISDIGKLEGVTQQRVSQVMGLLHLSPRLQERILTLPRQLPYSKYISTETCIQIALEIDFEKQEPMFELMYKRHHTH